MTYFPKLPTQIVIEDMVKRYPQMDFSMVTTHFLLLKISKDLYLHLESWLAEYGITQGRLIVLLLLFREPERQLTPSELADGAGVTRGTITGLIDGLERDHLIERKSHPKDRRMSTIRLTDKGEELMNDIVEPLYNYRAEIMSVLSKEEIQTLKALLEKISASLEHVKMS